MDSNTLFTAGAVYVAASAIAIWLAMIVWTYRDMRARSRDSFAQLLVSGMVAVLTVPGLLIYIFTRPRETLAEAYERSLEEEALLQEIEEKPSCPGCGQRMDDHWQVCPNCHTRLKRTCVSCRTPLELTWSICPVCTTPQPNYESAQVTPSYTSTAQADASPRISIRQQKQTTRQERAAEGLEFIDEDGY